MDVIKNEEELAGELQELSESVKKMAMVVERVEKKRYFSIIDQPWKFVFFSFLQGVAMTIGATLGVAIVIALIVYVLQYLGLFPGLSDTLKGLFPQLDQTPLIK